MIKEYFSALSPAQKACFAQTTTAFVAILCAGFLCGLFFQPPVRPSTPTTSSSLRQLVPELGVTGKSLARELELPLDASKRTPLSRLGVSQEALDRAASHILSHRAKPTKYFLFAGLVLFGLVFLLRLGRPDDSPKKARKWWYPRPVHSLALVVAVSVGGFALGKSPNPMESAVKVFKAMVGLYPSVAGKAAAFGFFLLLAVVGNKLICGWACPFGALQELLYSLPFLRRVKKRKPPFWLTNSIRGGLFVLMLLLLFGIVGSSEGFVLYHNLNPFNLFDLHFEHWTILATITVSLVLSFALYRPFCLLICPFGFLSWFVERLSLARVRIDKDKCTSCGACSLICPTKAMEGLVKGRVFAADCFSCGRCLKVCPEDALSYSFIGSRSPQENSSDKDGQTEPALLARPCARPQTRVVRNHAGSSERGHHGIPDS